MHHPKPTNAEELNVEPNVDELPGSEESEEPEEEE
jgi:hypothetical protein